MLCSEERRNITNYYKYNDRHITVFSMRPYMDTGYFYSSKSLFIMQKEQLSVTALKKEKKTS